MSKSKLIYLCSHCGAESHKWVGQCPECHSWNTLVEDVSLSLSKAHAHRKGFASQADNQITPLSKVTLNEESRIETSSSELNRVLGGGVVLGSVTLIGGDPGIGKSTLLLQTLCHMSKQHSALYVSGEESLSQITLRARRLGLPEDTLQLLTEIRVERIIAIAKKERPQVMVVDSIQTMFTEVMASSPGSVGQVRESAAQFVQFAKQTGIALFLVGHVTREGTIAGPRVLEHMVDTVLYFEGEKGNRFRIIRAVKNRFGAVNELGIFSMTEKGLREITNPSAIFLSGYEGEVSGSTVMVTWEGTRPLLVEVQALVDESRLSNPRRVVLGLEQNRLAMLLAVLHRHGMIATYDQDVFINVVGGVRVYETAIDLAILFSVISSLKNHALPSDLVVFGEVGLSGEIRPVQNGEDRLREAQKHGFKKAIIPKGNAPKKGLAGMDIRAVSNLQEALSTW